MLAGKTSRLHRGFARIFGFDSFEGFAEAVAYIGFAGTLKTATAMAPIAICQQALEICDVNERALVSRLQ